MPSQNAKYLKLLFHI